MKKFYTLFLLLVVTLVSIQSSNAQISITGKVSEKSVMFPNKITADFNQFTIDTLLPPIFNNSCSDTLVYYNIGTGYATGNCVISGVALGSECAQKYSYTGTANITDILVAYAYVTGTNGTTSAKVYAISPTTKRPTTVIGTSSNTVTTGNISTLDFTAYTFSPPLAITTDFAVSAVFPDPANGDTVAVTSTKLTCHSTDSLGLLYLGAYGWYFYTALFDRTSPRDTGLDVVILPVIDEITDVNSPPSSNGLSFLGSFPNPAKSFTNIRYQLDKSSSVSISVFDLRGKIYQHCTENLSAGKHEMFLDLKDMAAGTYFYTISTENAKMTSKFSVIK